MCLSLCLKYINIYIRIYWLNKCYPSRKCQFYIVNLILLVIYDICDISINGKSTLYSNNCVIPNKLVFIIFQQIKRDLLNFVSRITKLRVKFAYMILWILSPLFTSKDLFTRCHKLKRNANKTSKNIYKVLKGMHY